MSWLRRFFGVDLPAPPPSNPDLMAQQMAWLRQAESSTGGLYLSPLSMANCTIVGNTCYSGAVDERDPAVLDSLLEAGGYGAT